MDSSRRAVEAYWRSRMIDAVTSDEDKVAPVYKLEEVCDLLKTSHVSIVKEVSEYVLKRLDHKSPIVKQKTLRMIKYAVGKSGTEFRREMQRNAVALRQLFHYRGQVDPMKGDALNKAVRDTAHEAVSALFASDDKPAAGSGNVKKRMEGFGNTNFQVQPEGKKSFLSEVVSIGSTSILQGLSALTSSDSLMKDDSGSYKSPNLHRSLAEENSRFDSHDTGGYRRELWGSSGGANSSTRSWSLESREDSEDTKNTIVNNNQSSGNNPEDRLLDTIVTSGGVRLQPPRDAIQNFLKGAAKLDAISLCIAIESKLQSPVWQVRMKAACVLEAILRKKDNDFFALMTSYFSDKRDAILKCSETPQASVREKTNKVLSLLDENHSVEGKTLGTASNGRASEKASVQLPDLIDTVDLDSPGTEEASSVETVDQFDQGFSKSRVVSSHAIDDLFGDGLNTESAETESIGNGNKSDPFVDVSFHTSDVTGREHANDLFSGLSVDDKQSDTKVNELKNDNQFGFFDIFGHNFVDVTKDSSDHGKNLDDLMSGLSVKGSVGGHQTHGAIAGSFAETMTSVLNNPQGLAGQNDILNDLLNSQSGHTNQQNGQIPQSSTQYSFHPNFMFNTAFAPQVNYSAMSNLVAQQQLLATMSNIQGFGTLGNQGNASYANCKVGNDAGYSSALPDIFKASGYPIQNHTGVTNSPKKEDTRAFDFISDHISSVRDPKRIV